MMEGPKLIMSEQDGCMESRGTPNGLRTIGTVQLRAKRPPCLRHVLVRVYGLIL